ncbi:MAG: radical SAM family heme chaperone HemW [Peptoniphilus sp.]|nr:radical SAM family heme chaperone HemW [Peptoniphilus sp.]
MKKNSFIENLYTDQRELSLYVHVPFCESRCYYCDFCSSVIKDDVVAKYFNCLYDEIKLYADFLKNKEIVSIFIGGGTPSSVDSYYITQTIEAINNLTKIKSNAEITLEMNPNSASANKIKDYLKAGVNRFSLGAQSFDDHLLKKIGRIHTKNDILTCVDTLKNLDVENFSLDLMLGLPSQDLKDIENSIECINFLKPKHISYYSLILEEGTYLYDHREKYDFPEEIEDRKMYHFMRNELEKLSYNQYELSNFARKGYESMHNLRYWKLKNYLGLGMSSHSNIDNIRFWNTADFKEYFHLISEGNFAISDFETLTKKDRLNEHIMMALRLNEGIDIALIEEIFEIDFFEEYKNPIKKNISLNLISVDENNLKLTNAGMDFCNKIELDFFK